MMRKASFHHPCITVEEWDALAVQVTVAKADLSTRDGYSPNMLAFGRRPRLLPSCLDECQEDVITSISRAHSGDRNIQYLYQLQLTARQAADEIAGRFDVDNAMSRKCGKDPEKMDLRTGDSVYIWKKAKGRWRSTLLSLGRTWCGDWQRGTVIRLGEFQWALT